MAEKFYRKFTVKGVKIVLRPISEKDLEKLLDFINTLFTDKQQGRGSQVFTGFEQRVTLEEEADWLASRIAQIDKGDLVGVVAEVSGRIVANGNVERGHYLETRHHGELGLTVISDYRGMGIGRGMVEVLVEEAKQMGLKNLEVEFLSTNQAAVHTYQNAGFREVGRIPGKVYRSGKLLDSVIMAREI